MSVPVIHTSSGIVTGLTEGCVEVFRGIPYACSPLETGRFDAPVPFDSPELQIDGSRSGTVLPQISIGIDRDYPQVKDDDEWLTLNVFSPRTGNAVNEDDSVPLPIIVWVHGGSFISGTPASPSYDAVELASQGAVVVTITYRLGVDGFLHIPGHPDNRAVLDVVAALRWVQRNAASFGGDPARLTLAGQSAGALLALIVGVSDMAKGLVERLILQSPPALLTSLELAADVFEQLDAAHREKYGTGITEVGPHEAAKHVAEIGPDLIAANGLGWKRIGVGGVPLLPVIDGEIVRESPFLAFAESRLPALISHTTGEYRLFLHLAGALESMSAEAAQGLTFLTGANSAGYPGSFSAPQVAESAMTDRFFTAAAVDLLRARPASRQTYGVVFDSAPAKGIGAAHAIDVSYLFGGIDVELGQVMFPKPNVTDREIGSLVRRHFVGFVHGVPELVRWEDETVTLIADHHNPWMIDARHPLLDRYDAAFNTNLRGGDWIVTTTG
ncbi:carboxylesterase family protein [Enteractinococcus fodinae]|uniref:Carboxylic ester hydrolase n=1 Tax=Enteractinococcus fodinae TaxID=684663 RepID=A0ABU2B7R6_9MICC|nr:carboxylesterase family protein [Enteractinococcus fodinae]MDR7348429.1 para-nitrobenzyl esterase [Enteractinococcus fodinae]